MVCYYLLMMDVLYCLLIWVVGIVLIIMVVVIFMGIFV